MYEALYQYCFSHLDPERIHHFSVDLLAGAGQYSLTRRLLSSAWLPRPAFAPISLWGQSFMHPLGIAGGFDKDARCMPALQALGFSFIEVGTVTPQPQPGNPGPRLFRLTEDAALINRMGFPSAGMDALAYRLVGRSHAGVPVLISLGKNKTTPLSDAAQDYITVLNRLYDYGDGFVINISSPNTPDLRQLQTRSYLAELLGQLTHAMRNLSGDELSKPLFIKIAPDLEWADLDDILELGLQFGVSGVIATNTTVQRPLLKSPQQSELGGLSGQPLRQRSTEIIRYIHQHTQAKLIIIGVGGIFTGDDAWEKLRAGAALLQAYTGFIYKGPTFAKQVLRQLDAKMRQTGVTSYQDIVSI